MKARAIAASILLSVFMALAMADVACAEDPDKLLADAYIMMEKQRWADAEDLFRKYLAIKPDDQDVGVDLARVLREEKRFIEADAVLDAILKKNPNMNPALLQRALVHMDRKDIASAIADLNRLYARAPGFGEGWTEYYLGLSHYMRGDLANAVRFFKAAIDHNPTTFESYVNYYRYLGRAYYDLEQYDDAAVVIENAVKRYPLDPWFPEMLGWTYYCLGRYEDSAPMLDLSAKLGFARELDRSVPVMSLPFQGIWKVTLGNGEAPEHLGMLATHAWNFELNGPVPSVINTAGNEDFPCYGASVLAPADGIVQDAVDGIMDNLPGSPHAGGGPGNFVRIKHAERVFSMLSHLRQGSVAVNPGQWVEKGRLLGECGNSGDSSVPNLHFVVTFGKEKQWMTRKSEFGNYYIVEDTQKVLVKQGAPLTGQRIMPTDGPQAAPEAR